jgi:hypothetical protein
MFRRIEFMVLTEVKISVVTFWVMTTCMLVCGYRRFGEECASFDVDYDAGVTGSQNTVLLLVGSLCAVRGCDIAWCHKHLNC